MIIKQQQKCNLQACESTDNTQNGITQSNEAIWKKKKSQQKQNAW